MTTLERAIAVTAAVATTIGAGAARVHAQDFDRGRFVPGVQLAVGLAPYDIAGSTALQLFRQLEVAGRPYWVRYPAQFTWSYDAEVIPRVNGTPSDQCRFTDFELTLDFTAVFPRWTAGPDADPELTTAWEAFQENIERQWALWRDEYLDRAQEAVRRSRGYEDHCPLLRQRFHSLVVELLDRSRDLDGRETLRPADLTWPPAGYEHLLTLDQRDSDDRTAPGSESPDAGDRAGEAGGAELRAASGDVGALSSRPGMPRPSTTPAASLDFAIATDRRGSQPTGFVVALDHQGTLQYLDAFGSTPEGSAALTIDAVFPVPAFTEVLISTLAVALDASGVIDLDAPISRYLDGLSPRLGGATVGQLLEHRAGLDNAPPLDSTAWERALDRLSDRALFTEPGSVASYSSYSFGLAARVIERATGTTVEDAIRRTLVVPLDMRSTTLGPRDAEDAAHGLPVTHTTAPDLLRFWYAWLDGRIAGAGPDLLPTPAGPSLELDGQHFARGLWIDRPGAMPRLSLMCGGAGADAAVQLFPATRTIVLALGYGALPRHTAIFLLDAVAETLRIGNAIYAPVTLAGTGRFGQRERRCDHLRTSRTYQPEDFGPRAEAGEWAGRYINGDWFVALEERGGLLVSPDASVGEAWDVHHFSGEVYFAATVVEDGRRAGFPFRLFIGDDGRRYLMRGDRAYLHEADRPGR